MASFGLRVAAYSMGNTANTMVLDEGFKFLSRDLQARAGEIISEISKKLGLQLIINTHIPELVEQSDKVFRVQLQKEGKWEVSKVSVMEE